MEKGHYYCNEVIEDVNDLDHIPFSDLYNSNLLEFFVDEEVDEFIQAENEESLKEALAEPLEGRVDDFLATEEAVFAEDPEKQEMIAIIKQELPVLLQFTDQEVDWEEIYKAFDFKDMPTLPENHYWRLFLRDKLMALLGIDAEVFKDSFYYFDSLDSRGAPVRRADIISVYKKVQEMESEEASMRKVKQVFDELVQQRRMDL